MDKLRLSEKVLSIRVNNGLYENLVKYAKDKDTTISEITRQLLELFYFIPSYNLGNTDTREDKEIFDMVFEIHEDLDSLNLESPANKELIQELAEIQQAAKQAIKNHREIEKDLNKRIEALERLEKAIEEEWQEALKRVKKRVLNQFENETQLEGSSAPSSLVHCEELYQAAECER